MAIATRASVGREAEESRALQVVQGIATGVLQIWYRSWIAMSTYVPATMNSGGLGSKPSVAHADERESWVSNLGVSQLPRSLIHGRSTNTPD